MWTRLAVSTWSISLPSTSNIFKRGFAIMSEGKLAGPTNTSKRLADLRTLMNKNPKVDA